MDYFAGPMAQPDDLSAVASIVNREWGSYGYRIGCEAAGFGGSSWVVRCSDGSEFRLVLDRWQNWTQPLDGEELSATLERLHAETEAKLDALHAAFEARQALR